jgi:hypothetical protein
MAEAQPELTRSPEVVDNCTCALTTAWEPEAEPDKLPAKIIGTAVNAVAGPMT